MLDLKECDRITVLVEMMATSGKELDVNVFKELTRLAGQSEQYLKFALERIFLQLEQKHCEIRLGAFSIIDQLFGRSHYFRELLLDEFPAFLELTVESNPDKLLPPPLHVAKVLKIKVLQTIDKWHSKYGTAHKRLQLGYNFLKNNLKVDFEDALKRNAAEIQVSKREEEKKAKLTQKKLEEIEGEMKNNLEEIMRVVTEMDNCFCLLIPKPENAFSNAESQLEKRGQREEDMYLREHGFLLGSTIAVDLKNKLGQVEENEDNSVIIENLKDFDTLLKNRYLKMIKNWVVITSKAKNQFLFRKAIDVKNMVEEQLQRFDQIKLVRNTVQTTHHDADESDTDDETTFEEVPEKLGYEIEAVSPVVQADCQPGTSKSMQQEMGWRLWNVHDDDAKDPTTFTATLKSFAANNSKKMIEKLPTGPPAQAVCGETRKQKLLRIAPKLPFDVDLYHWEDKNLKAPSIEIVERDGHKFWTPSQDREGEVISDPNGISSLRTRVIEFAGNFEPVKWSCRAPLRSGLLCPRKDRVKCPLHGKIIARDNMGNPTNLEDIKELEKAKEIAEANKPPDWQDPEFLKDIEAATGMDLTVKPSKRGKQKKKTFAELYPGLTDIEKKRNNPRSRLEKIVFNKSSMKRVAEAMDDHNSKRFRDKFGDQWNYSMSNN